MKPSVRLALEEKLGAGFVLSEVFLGGRGTWAPVFLLAVQLEALALFLILVFRVTLSRTRYQCLGLHQKKASNVRQETREDEGSSENDERRESDFVWVSGAAPGLEREGPAEWPQQGVPVRGAGPTGTAAMPHGLQR